ncbi:LysR substrate-binding domain-containing protein [Paragemmobacter ruber]|nr:LysR substrate-binding domain-containing protein [Rhodobacter ruber]
MQIPLNSLRAFEAVVRTGSFKAAADVLFVTQSAVSHQVRHLEEWLGAPLFDRAGGRPRLLPAGQDLARAVSLSLAEMEAACDRARAGLRAGPLVIAAIPSVAVCWLIPRLAGFRAAHPEVELRVIYAMHGRDVDYRDVHLAFVFAKGPLEGAGVGAEPFLSGASVPVCSPALLQGRRAERPSDYLSLGLLHDTDTGGWAEWFRRAGVPLPMTAEVRTGAAVFEDFNLLRAAALAGQGVALCPLAMIRPDLEAGRLVQLSEVSVMEDWGYHLVTGRLMEGAQMQAAQAFRDWAYAAREDAGARDGATGGRNG